MPVVTFLSNEEINLYKSVEDRELNTLFQEVRNTISNNYLIRTFEIKEKKWFSNPKIKYRYCLYYNLGSEVQVLNFPDSEPYVSWMSSSDIVTKETIITYFLGLLNGFEKGIKYDLQRKN